MAQRRTTQRPQFNVKDTLGQLAERIPQRSTRSTSSEKTASGTRYVNALDGLRALAVLSVIAYHMKMNWAPGGLLGVTMFFVLSGYLITGLLLVEHEKTGSISLKGFWLRRVRRIIPAVVFGVAGTAVLCTLFSHALLTKMRPDVLPTLLFFNNWWQIFSDASYWVAMGQSSPLMHYWSLSIEEQFYLIWPLALLACFKFGVSRNTMQKGIIVLILLSALEMALLYSPTGDPSRVYYGTDTRAFSLLIGSLLAFIWPYQAFPENAGDRMDRSGRIVLDAVGVVAIVLLLVMVAVTNGYSAFVYRGGLLLCSLITAVAIAVMVHPASLVGRVFGCWPLVWIGKRSYSMYLWHYPIILLMTDPNLVGEAPLWLRLIQLVVIFAISGFSYSFVENPVRHGAIGRWIKSLRAGKFTIVGWVQQHVVPVAASAVILLVGIGGLIFVPDTSFVGSAEIYQQQGQTPSGAASSSASSAEGADASGASAGAAGVNENAYDILLIGDSVSVRTIPYFEDMFPYGHIDALVNRNIWEGNDLYAWYRDQGLVGDVVVISLGTNNYVVDEQVDDLMNQIGPDKHVWFITCRSTEDFVTDTNDAYWRATSRYSNVSVIDWYGISEGHPEYFDGDGTHLNEESAALYTRMIYDVVRPYLPERSIAAVEGPTAGA